MLKKNKETETKEQPAQAGRWDAWGKHTDPIEPRPGGGRFQTRRLVLCALFVALGVVLGGLLNIPAMPFGVYSVKIGLGTLPVILSGVLFGPIYGGIVGGLTDFLQAMLFPKGAYLPWFTITGVLFGLIPGLFFIRRRKPTFPRILLAVFAGQTIGSALLNSWLIYTTSTSIASDLTFPMFLVPRAINQAVMIPVYSVLVYYLVKALRRMRVIETE